MQGLQSQGSQLTAPDVLPQASAALDSLKTNLSQLSEKILTTLSTPALDLSAAQTALAASLTGSQTSFATSFSSLQDRGERPELPCCWQLQTCVHTDLRYACALRMRLQACPDYTSLLLVDVLAGAVCMHLSSA